MPMSNLEPKVKSRTFQRNVSVGFSIALLLVTTVYADDVRVSAENRNRNSDQQTYCRYLTEQAAAQRDLL
ncbi:MAG: hypothetical protein ABSB14_00935, partial [Candidatus Sulfotelmatobacter sp.]